MHLLLQLVWEICFSGLFGLHFFALLRLFSLFSQLFLTLNSFIFHDKCNLFVLLHLLWEFTTCFLDKERIDVSVKWGYNIFGRRVSVLERKIINYIVVCINEFALSKNLTEQEAFRYLYANKGIEFLTENYDVEHTLSLQDAVNDLSIVCRNNGGMIQWFYIMGLIDLLIK